jgi:peptidoglycan/LPS O-acetylase OafA/YrhL
MRAKNTAFRKDIQALRGLAVMLVVLDHFSVGPFAHGYLGVDIFFVISGFLITHIIARDIQSGSFSFQDFYFNRARRILPAALMTVLLVIVLSPILLSSEQLKNLNFQAMGAVSFTMNFVLWKRVDYFALEADRLPLLHFWSLAVEEQFYIFFPVLLVLLPRHAWKLTLSALAAASLVLCIAWAQQDPSGAFYLLPTRAWELLMGALGALLYERAAGVRWLTGALSFPALFVLVIVPVNPSGFVHPGLDAFAVCLSTLIILLAHNESAARTPIGMALSRIGDISYSLYLAHWPIAVFMYSAVTREISISDRLSGLAIAFLAALLLYHLVEKPFRRKLVKGTLGLVAGAAAISCLLVVSQYGFYHLVRMKDDFIEIRRANYGLSKSCNNGTLAIDIDKCRTAKDPATAVWGDSHAMHLVPGLSEALKGGLIQITRSSCGPYFMTSQIPKDVADANNAASQCIAFNTKVLEVLMSSPTIKQVVLAGQFRSLLDPQRLILVQHEDGRSEIHAGGIEIAMEAIGRATKALQAAGKKVVVFGSPPQLTGPESDCAERRIRGLITIGGHDDCSLAYETFRQRDRPLNELLDRLEKRFGLEVVRLSDALCREGRCFTQIDGTVLYRDHHHLTYAGSKLAVKRLDLAIDVK